MALIDDSTVDLGMVESKLGQLERERNEARKEAAQRTEDILKAADMIDEYRVKANHWCDLHTVASKRSEEAIVERDQLRARVTELEKENENLRNALLKVVTLAVDDAEKAQQ